MLILKIENFDRLADGGQLSYRADRRGFDFGRGQHLDWNLPDPSRQISSTHCEIRFFDNAYWLYDVSANGTFVNRNSRRVQSPYRLTDGDELQVGDYVISVSVAGVEGATPSRTGGHTDEAGHRQDPSHDELWSSPTKSPPPISRQDLMPEIQRGSRSADFLNKISDLPPPAPDDVAGNPMAKGPASSQSHPAASLWATTGVESRPPAPPPQGWPAAGAEQPRPAQSMASLTRDIPFVAAGPAPRPPAAPPRGHGESAYPPHAQAAGHPPEAGRAQIEAEFLRQFAAGAGVPESLFAGRPPAELAYEMGGILRLVCAQLMQVLKVRAETKSMIRTADRTMIEASENNALKFTPNPEAALALIFGSGNTGYLDAKRTIGQSFADILGHEEATFSAMQRAVQQMFDDLSPQAIVATAGGNKRSFLGSGKAKYWEIYAEKWREKEATGEHGMLDAFLDLFAACYDEASPRRR